MAAPRKYSDAQRAAMFALYRQGCTPAEIARMCSTGLVSVGPFSIPRRTVQSIVRGMATELGATPARPDSELSLEERVNDIHQNVPGGRIVKTSGFDEFEGITRYSWDVVDAEGNTASAGLDVVEEGADGRLQRIVMFHRPLPTLG